MIQPLLSDLLTGTFLHRLFHIIARNIRKQTIYPYANLIFVLILELSLSVDGPAKKPLGILAAYNTSRNDIAGSRIPLTYLLDGRNNCLIGGCKSCRLPVSLANISLLIP